MRRRPPDRLRPRRALQCRLLTVVLAAGVLTACGVSSTATDVGQNPVRIAAAASLADVLQDLEPLWREGHERPWELNLAGSNVLARQIEAASTADLFLSADARWVESLVAAGRVAADDHRTLFGNRLVLVTRRDAALAIDAPLDLVGASYRHLAVADPVAVPAGRYARAQLEAISAPGREAEDAPRSLWQVVEQRIVPTLDVRAALGLVASDPEIVGLVYRTDALGSKTVAIRHVFEPVVPIRYFAALVAEGDRPAAQSVLEFLDSPRAREVVRRHGFEVGDAGSAAR
ncbi:MAG: molybdate ABC transporter substrate-binding protein [Acidobacteriota bacterium]